MIFLVSRLITLWVRLVRCLYVLSVADASVLKYKENVKVKYDFGFGVPLALQGSKTTKTMKQTWV
jgi:hypothetical protein